MANEKVPMTGKQLASVLMRAVAALHSLSDEEAEEMFDRSLSSLHFHDGSQGDIAWNDVQAINLFNELVLGNEAPLIEVPTEPSEGYNQHHHTSEFDGGQIPGVLGVHDHRDNANGGFAFAVFHPGTDVPQADWEQ